MLSTRKEIASIWVLVLLDNESMRKNVKFNDIILQEVVKTMLHILSRYPLYNEHMESYISGVKCNGYHVDSKLLFPLVVVDKL